MQWGILISIVFQAALYLLLGLKATLVITIVTSILFFAWLSLEIPPGSWWATLLRGQKATVALDCLYGGAAEVGRAASR